MNTVLTKEEKEILTKMAIEEMGEEMGRMYIDWYDNNARKIADEWFGGEYGKDYSDTDLRHNAGLGIYIVAKFSIWMKEEFGTEGI